MRLSKFRAALRYAPVLAAAAAAVVLAVLPAGAEPSATATDVAPADVRHTSDRVAVFGVNMVTNGVPVNDTLDGAKATFTSVAGFTSSDIATDGVILVRDDGDVDDQLDASDSAVTSTVAFDDSCADGSCTATMTVSNGTIPTVTEGAYTYFLAIQTSGSIDDADQFTVTLPSDAFTTSPMPLSIQATTSNTITARRTVASATDVAPGTVGAESGSVVLFETSVVTPSALPDTLSQVVLDFTSTAGFTTEDLLADQAGADSDGLQVWRDSSRTGDDDDALDAGDALVSSGFSFDDDCSDGACTATVTITDGALPTAAEGATTHFIAIRTRASIADGDTFSVTAPAAAFTTSPSTTAITSASTGGISADLTAPNVPDVSALGLDVAAGVVRVGGTAVSTETSGVLEVYRSPDAACIGETTFVAESAVQNLTVTNTDLLGGDADERSALQNGFTPGTDNVCYRVRDEAGNQSSWIGDGGIPTAPSSTAVGLLSVRNVSGQKRILAAQDTAQRTYRLYLAPGGTGTERAKDETGAYAEITTSTSAATSTSSTDLRQWTSGATLAAGDGIHWARVNGNGNNGPATADGAVPAAPTAGDIALLSASAVVGNERVVAQADDTPGDTFGLFIDPAGGTAWSRAITSSGGATPVRVTTAAGEATSGTETIFGGPTGTDNLGPGHAVGYVLVSAEGHESEVTADETIPSAPAASDMSLSDAEDTVTASALPAGATVRLFLGAAADGPAEAYAAGVDADISSTDAVAVADPAAGATIYYTAVDTSSGNESPTVQDGTVPAAPVAGDTALLSTSAADGHQRVVADADAAGPRTFGLFLQPASTWIRARTAAGGGGSAVTVATATDGSASSGTVEIFAGSDPLAAAHGVGYALVDGDGNDSDVTASGSIPQAPAAADLSVSDALNEMAATSATANYEVRLHVGAAGDAPADAYSQAGPDAAATSDAPVSITDPVAGETLYYTAVDPATGNESPTVSDGTVPQVPDATAIGRLGVAAAEGHQRLVADPDGADAPRTFRLYLDVTNDATWVRASATSGGSAPVEVTTTAGDPASSGTASLFAGATQIAAGHDAAYARVDAGGNDSDVAADSATIPAAPDVTLASASAADDTVRSSEPAGTLEVRVFASTSTDAPTAYGEGVDVTLETTTAEALDTSSGDRLYYTILDTASGHESAIAADGSIPAALTAADTSASDALDQVVVPGAAAASPVRIFFDASSSAATAYANGHDYEATSSPFAAPADLPAGQYVYFTVRDDASGNESPVTADGSVPGAPTGASSVMSASAAHQTVTANAEGTSRTLRLYVTPSAGSMLRATTTAAGTTPVEITTGSSSVQSAVGIFRDGAALTDGDAVAYARVVDGNDSDVVSDGTIPAAPADAAAFGADARTTSATIGATAASGTYRVFRNGAPASNRVSHDNGLATTVSLSALAPGDTVGYALTESTNANESPLLADGAIPSAASLDLTPGSDSGISDTDDITSETMPVFSVGAGTGGSATIFEGDTELGSAVAGEDGIAYPQASALADGAHPVTATVTNTAGNTSPVSDAVTVTVDTVAPASAPSGLDLVASSDTGRDDADEVTTDATPSFAVSGVEAAGAVYKDGVLAAMSEATDGTATVTVATLADGTYQITATNMDAAGNESAHVDALPVTVDTVAPAAPSAPDLAGGSDSGVSATDNLTNDATPTFSVPDAAADLARIVEGETVVASGDPAAVTVTDALADGEHAVAATVEDLAGNVSGASPTLTITVDTAAPAAPAAPNLIAEDDTGLSDTDDVTLDATPRFQLTGLAAGTTVALYAGDTVVASAPAGDPLALAPTDALADGEHVMTATAEDDAGNESARSTGLTVTVDTVAPTGVPSAPDLVVSSDLGRDNADNVTADSTPTVEVSGGEDGAALYVDGALAASAAGEPAAITTGALADGTYSLTAKSIDTAGNVGATASDALSITVDTVAPAVPATPDLAAASDTGSASDDDVTADATPDIVVDGAATSDLVRVYSGDDEIGSAIAASAVTITPATALADGEHQLRSTAQDVAGNESDPSATLSVTVDTAAPAVPSVALAPGSDTGFADGTTTDATPTVRVTGAAGEQATVLVDAAETASGTLAGGTFDATLGPLDEGTYSVTATSTDLAGNASAASGALSVQVVASFVAFDGDEYGYREAVGVSVEDAEANDDPAVEETIDVVVSSDSDGTGITVTLTETGANTGAFTGALALVSRRTVQAEGLLKAAEGDGIDVSYDEAQAAGRAGAAAVRADTATVMTVFTDDAGSSHEPQINAIWRAGITSGCTADGTRYCPSGDVTRGAMAKFLAEALNLPEATQDYFTDDDGTVFEPFNNRLREAEITTGCTADGTSFCPNGRVTRDQMAAFLVRAFGLADATQDYFTDDAGTVYEPFINSLREAGITTGCNAAGTLYCPRRKVSRAEMATFLARALDLA